MGQKIHPTGLRIGIVEDWRSHWYAHKKDFSKFLVEDHKIRDFVKKRFYFAGIPKIEIERTGEEVEVLLYTARPGIVIGRRGVEVERLRSDLEDLINRRVAIDIKEVNRPELEAQLVAENVAEQLEKRASFRRVMKRAVEMSMDMGAQGVKAKLSGRLAGAEMSRTETESAGKIPLHTLRAKIDYGFTEAKTTYGHIGVKVWIYKGEVKGEGIENAPDAKKDKVQKKPAR